MKFDLHIHSQLSFDSLSKIDRIVTHAKKCGLNGISITDHNVFKDIPSNFVYDEYFWLIPGSEIHTEIGDIIGLFISKNLKMKKSIDLIKEIHDQNGIAILAHPFKRIQQYPELVISNLDAVEVINSRWVDLNNYKHDTKVTNLMNSVSGRSGGSDAHFLFEIGRTFLATPKISSPHDLKRIIIEGKGEIFSKAFSSWLDEASQLINLYKNPSFYQVGRIFYRLMRRLIKGNPAKIFYENVK